MPAAVPVYRYIEQLTLREYLGNIGKPHILLRWPAGGISGIGALMTNTSLMFSRSHWESKLDGAIAIADERDKFDPRLEFYSVIDENDTIFKHFGLDQRHKHQVITKPPSVLFVNGGMKCETADVEQVESVVRAAQGAQF